MQQTRSIIRAATLQPRPWPNGLGITRDVTAQNQTQSGFDWLISIADLVESAAFSHFPDGDRIFTLIDGTGVTLTIDDAAMPCKPFVPASFPGDRPTFCTMSAGPARAFNLFFDRRHFTGSVAVRTIAAAHTIHAGAHTAAIFCVSGTLDLAAEILEPGDTLAGSGTARIRAAGQSATAIIVEIERL